MWVIYAFLGGVASLLIGPVVDLYWTVALHKQYSLEMLENLNVTNCGTRHEKLLLSLVTLSLTRTNLTLIKI